MKPVFRSCEVSPAIDAAIQTAVPTISAVALPSASVQPIRREDQAGAEQRGDGHPRRRVGGHADQAHDARADRDEEESEDGDQQRGQRSTGLSRVRCSPGCREPASAPAGSRRRSPAPCLNDRSRSVRSTAAAARVPIWDCPRPSLNDSIIVGIELDQRDDPTGGHRTRHRCNARSGSSMSPAVMSRISCSVSGKNGALQTAAPPVDHRDDDQRRQRRARRPSPRRHGCRGCSPRRSAPARR